MSLEGFIVHAYARIVKGRTRLYFLGRLREPPGQPTGEGGGTFAVVQEEVRPEFFVRLSEAARVAPAAEGSGAALGAAEYRTMDGEPVLRVSCPTVEARQSLRDALHAQGLRTYEADLRVTDQFRIQRKIHGGVSIRGESRPGRHVGRIFLNPELQPAEFSPRLSVLSIDIETDPANETVRAVALCHRNPAPEGGGPASSGAQSERVLFLGPELAGVGSSGSGRPPGPGAGQIERFTEERALLARFGECLRRLDPDIVTGWNVVDFDLQVLARRFRQHRLPFRIGRSREEAAYLPQSEGRGSRVIVPGRQVWDAVRIVRAAPQAFEDYSLETVASAILGYGKRIEIGEGESRLLAIERLYAQDPQAFCAYCLQDARLVLEIFDATGLLELTLRRCGLIGVAPELAWTSIAAFEHLYIEALHGRGLVAPSFGVDPLPLAGAPGGAILSPQPGLYDDVLVFDFQSLYPSIMRSFNIDPAGYVPPAAIAGLPAEVRAQLIRAPNGACFRREPGILPQLLDRFFERREQAQAAGDRVASFVYKIIMNSFYGVLGASGCRFAGSALAGAVTSFGQRILSWCRGLLERHGYTVLYGDTDSLFVTGRRSQADGICRLVNDELAGYLRSEYRIQPRLTLRFEKHYLRFFLPPLRGGAAEVRGTAPVRREAGAAAPTAGGAAGSTAGGPTGPTAGRAKGYAGLLAPEPGAAGSAAAVTAANGIVAGTAANGTVKAAGEAAELLSDSRVHATAAGRIEIKGMEAVRRDWTDLAHDFQVRLLELVFARRSLTEIQEYVATVLRELRAGSLDGKLVYRKALRKAVSEYTRSTPPHVKAAALLEAGRRRGLIRYVVTLAGPQPVGRLTAAVDYEHYVDKQLKPIASAFTQVLGTDVGELFGSGAERQLQLF